MWEDPFVSGGNTTWYQCLAFGTGWCYHLVLKGPGTFPSTSKVSERRWLGTNARISNGSPWFWYFWGGRIPSFLLVSWIKLYIHVSFLWKKGPCKFELMWPTRHLFAFSPTKLTPKGKVYNYCCAFGAYIALAHFWQEYIYMHFCHS